MSWRHNQLLGKKALIFQVSHLNRYFQKQCEYCRNELINVLKSLTSINTSLHFKLPSSFKLLMLMKIIYTVAETNFKQLENQFLNTDGKEPVKFLVPPIWARVYTCKRRQDTFLIGMIHLPSVLSQISSYLLFLNDTVPLLCYYHKIIWCITEPNIKQDKINRKASVRLMCKVYIIIIVHW